MRLFWRREAISGLRAAQWSGAGQLAREGFERNPMAYRCVRLISEAAASVGVAAEGDDDAMARLLSRPNIEEHGADLAAVFAPVRKAALTRAASSPRPSRRAFQALLRMRA